MHLVAVRTREIGLVSLSARSSPTFKRSSSAGARGSPRSALIGVALALTGARLLKSFLYCVSATNPITFTGIGLLPLTVALLACWIPSAARAGLAPITALRAE